MSLLADGLARGRTATLVGSVLTALSSGTNYVYSAYAPQLGTRLHISYTQLNIIGLSGNMGVYTTGPIFGRIVDKRGPQPLLISSLILLFVGYIGLRSYFDAGPSSDEKLPLFSLIVMSLFSYMTGAGGCAGLNAGSNSTAKSFPERLRATTVGLVVSGFGLSAFFFSTLAHWFFPGNTSSFLLFLAVGTALPVMIGIFIIRPVPHAERSDADTGGSTLHSETGAVDSSSHLLGHGGSTTINEHNLHGFVGLGSGVSEENEVYIGPHDTRTTGVYPEAPSTDEVPYMRSPSVELSPSRSVSRGRRPSSRRSVNRTKHLTSLEHVDTHGKRLLIGWEFWLLFSILSLLSGTGLMFINNVGSIAQALSAKGNPEYDTVKAGKLQAAQVSIISLANCGARIGVGMGADFLKSRFAAHRSYLLSLISILFIISQLVASQVENVNHLWKTSIILGLGYGGIFGLLPTITIDWFGMAHLSENWGFVSMAPLFGGNIFSILFGHNLDAHVPGAVNATAISSPVNVTLGTLDPHSRAPGPELGRQCLEGRVCYAESLAITTFACVLALLLSLVAAWRDRRKASAADQYQSLQQEVIWEDEDEA